MADIDTQMTANGLPTSFESSAHQPEVDHSALNTAATISNSDIYDIHQNAPHLDVISKPVVVSRPDGTEKSQSNNVDLSLNQDDPALPPPPPAADVEAQVVETDFISATKTPVLTEPLGELPSIDIQADLSDLRTAPHSDGLSADQVATIEDEKHAQDDAADVTPSIAQPNGISSPPPAPQPQHAELPDHPNRQNGGEHVSLNGLVAVPADVLAQPMVPSEDIIISSDADMIDVPTQSAKISREREEEDVESDQPATKRVKTDEDLTAEPPQTPFKVPASPARQTAPPTSSDQGPDDLVTPLRLQHMKRVVSNLKKSNASAAFRLPVDYVALNIPSYPTIVTQPMDLSKLDTNLKENVYTSVQQFVHDFELIVNNCVTFNGESHAVTQAARKMQATFNNQMQSLPAATAVEPSKKDKVVAKLKIEPVRPPQPARRSSVSSSAKAASPKATPSPATFAPDPNGMPLLRRDSALDGRPKRAIVPTKRNSDFGAARPRKKKYELELRFCDEILRTIQSPKHWVMNQYFMHPVDPVALNIPTYFQIIKKPMDLNTMRTKLDAGQYERAKDFEEDFRLIVKNCNKFNPEGDYVRARGQDLEDLFNKEWAKKQDWIMAREPDSDRGTPADDEEEDESSEDDEDEDDDSGDDRQKQIQKLQAQIEAMSKQMGDLVKTENKKKKSPGVSSSKKDKKKKKKKDRPTTNFPNLPKSSSSVVAVEKPKKTKAKKEKESRYVTFAEKQYISNGIGMLPERQMAEALRIIQANVPHLANSADNEIELDIEDVPNHALIQLLDFVRKYAGPPPEEIKAEQDTGYTAPVLPNKKRSKHLSRQEQEAQIAELKGSIQNYAEGASPGAIPSIEDAGSEDDSAEESEED